MKAEDCPIRGVYTISFLAILQQGGDCMRWFAGMPRKRTLFGMWLDEKGVSQTELSRRSGVASKTINSLSTGEVRKPTRLTGRKLMKAIREVEPGAKESDFWDV